MGYGEILYYTLQENLQQDYLPKVNVQTAWFFRTNLLCKTVVLDLFCNLLIRAIHNVFIYVRNMMEP